MLFYSELRPKQIELWTDSNSQMNFFNIVKDTVSTNFAISRSGPIDSCYYWYQGSFSCSIGTQKAKNLFVLKHKIQSFNSNFPIFIDFS